MIARLLGAGLAFVLTAVAVQAQDTLPDIGGAYDLRDQYGLRRSEADPDGHPQLLFFGYANCQEICSAALPLMGQTAEILAGLGQPLTPVMITVDPERDTVATIGAPLTLHHPDFIGLTGRRRALQRAYDAFDISFEEMFVDPEFGPVLSHGSFLYLLDGQGTVLTMLPPILAPDHLAQIIADNLARS